MALPNEPRAYKLYPFLLHPKFALEAKVPNITKNLLQMRKPLETKQCFLKSHSYYKCSCLLLRNDQSLQLSLCNFLDRDCKTASTDIFCCFYALFKLVIRKPSGSHQAVIKQSTGSHQASPGSFKAVIKHELCSSDIHN